MRRLRIHHMSRLFDCNLCNHYKNHQLNFCKKFNAVILDKTKKSIVIQITALRRDIDKVSVKLKSLGLVSASRTGAVAMTRGAEVFK